MAEKELNYESIVKDLADRRDSLVFSTADPARTDFITAEIIRHSHKMVAIFDNTNDLCTIAENDGQFVSALKDHVNNGKALYYVYNYAIDPTSKMSQLFSDLQTLSTTPDQVIIQASTPEFNKDIENVFKTGVHFIIGDEDMIRAEKVSADAESNKQAFTCFKYNNSIKLLRQFNTSLNTMTGKNIKIVEQEPKQKPFYQRVFEKLCA